MSEEWFDARSECSDTEALQRPKRSGNTRVAPLFSKENVPPFGIYGRTQEAKALRASAPMARIVRDPRSSAMSNQGFYPSRFTFPSAPLGADDRHPWQQQQTLLPQAYGSDRLSMVDVKGALGAPVVRKSGRPTEIEIYPELVKQEEVAAKKKKKKSKRAKADAGADGDKKPESGDEDGEKDNTKTTVMVRNLPNRYPIPKLIEVLRANGAGPFNYFYAPMDLRYKHNVGYCFLNFFHPKDAAEFKVKFRGFTLPDTLSKKVMDVDYAMTQGFQANVDETCARLKVSSVGVPKACQPIFFDMEGNEISPPETAPAKEEEKEA